MSLTWPLFTATPIYNKCAIRFPGSGTIGEIEIPLHLTKYVVPGPSSTIVETSYGGVVDTNTGLTVGGTALSLGSSGLNLLQIEGWIDTPTVLLASSDLMVPGIVIDGYNVMYAEIIAAYFEGRTTSNYIGVFPRWFRDSVGKVYGDQTPTGSLGFIRIYDFTAQRVETVPGRNTFTMTLQVS